MTLNISEKLSLPREAATWVISYLAKRGAGKTYCSADQAEEMVKDGIPIVVIDGMGIWWGLRVSADGKHPGLPIVVFGGEHADLPLVPEKAGEMAKAVVESNISCVLDLSTFTKYAARKIVKDFLNELYRLNRVERHVFIEEADLWAPQKPIGPEEGQCLSAVDNFVRRGGNHNLGCTLITQRSAVLNKDILTQSDCLVVLRTLAPQDKKAIQAWVEEQTDEDRTNVNKWYDSLKELENGEAWIWHPERPKIFEKVKFRQRETFHATREFIKSPQASKIMLMSVDAFVERFKKVFHSDTVMGSNPIPGVNDKLVADLRRKNEDLEARLKEVSESDAKLADALEAKNKEVAKYAKLKEALEEFLPIRNASEIGVATPNNSTIALEHIKKVVSVEESRLIVPTIRTDTVKGKILALAQSGYFDVWRSVGDINTKLIDDFRFNTSDQAINGALKELVDEQIFGMKHTDRNRWELAPNIVFEGKKEVA